MLNLLNMNTLGNPFHFPSQLWARAGALVDSRKPFLWSDRKPFKCYSVITMVPMSIGP